MLIKAVSMMQRRCLTALAGLSKHGDLSTLNTVSNLGSSTKSKAVSEMRRSCSTMHWPIKNPGHLKDAESTNNCSLAGFEKTLGPEHTSTLNMVNYLGILYADLGCLHDAEIMFNRALAGREKTLGLEHSTIHNLSCIQ